MAYSDRVTAADLVNQGGIGALAIPCEDASGPGSGIWLHWPAEGYVMAATSLDDAETATGITLPADA